MPRRNNGPRLELNDRGVWEIRWHDTRSRRRSTGATDRREAELVLAGFLQGGGHLAPESKPLTVADLIDAYCTQHLRNGPVTGAQLEDYLYPKLRAFFGHLPPDKLQPADWIAYMTARREGGIATARGVLGRKAKDGTLDREGRALLTVFKYAIQTRAIPATCLPHLPIPQPPPARDRVLTKDELAALFREAARGRDVTGRLTRLERFVAIAFYAPQRQTAIRTRQWFSVDFATNLVDFRDPGRRETSKRRVPVPMAHELRAILERAYAEKTGVWVLDHPGPIREPFMKACQRAGLADVTPHTLRHTWATWQVAAGVPLWKVAGVLGDTVATVERKYAHLQPDHLRDAIETGWRPPRSETA